MEYPKSDISQLGEFGLIKHLTANNETKQAGTILSIGDDAAIIDHFGRQSVITTDLLIEDVHFDLSYTPLRYLGYKAVAVNLSDVFAMGATPTHITCGIALSSRFTVEAVEELYEGIYEACDQYQVDLIGGDTASSKKGLVLSVTAIGEVAPDHFITRSGAKPNDLICVTGNLGAAYLGLLLLEREKKILKDTPNVTPDWDGKQYLIRRLLRPEPREDVVNWLRESNIWPTAMIDISDGLSSELLHLCTQSNTGCIIFEDKLPIHEQAREMADVFQMSATTCALNGGEDYELLFTIPPQAFEQVKDNPAISVIGYMTQEEDRVLQTPSGALHKLSAQGWNAFAT